MSLLARCTRSGGTWGAVSFAPLSRSCHGRNPAYRRLCTPGASLCLSSRLRISRPICPSLGRSRSFHPGRYLLKDQQQRQEDIRDPPRSATQDAGPANEESPRENASERGQSEESSDAKKKSEDDDSGARKDAEDDKSSSPPPPPPPHGDKTPWQVFTDTLKTEFEASKEWSESRKALASSANQIAESESLKRARAAYSAASEAASSTTSSALKTTGKAIGKSAAWTWGTPVVKGVRAGVSATGKVIEKGTRPVRETEAYKKAVGEVKEVIDDGSSSRYGGWVDKDERKRLRELREMNEAKAEGRVGRRAEKIEADPDAGTNVTLHKDAAWKESWRNFKDSNRLMQSVFSLKSAYEESENPLVSTARSISDRFAGFFAENEMARVIKKFREMDPAFKVEPFLRDMREYILPEVLDAYVKGDVETLRLWLSDAQVQVYAALNKEYAAAGLKSDGRILDIRHVDIMSARLLEPGDTPVFIITCRTQEVHVYRNAKTNDLAAGMEDRVQLVTYAIGVTRVPEDVHNMETSGWRLIEMQKSSARNYI